MPELSIGADVVEAAVDVWHDVFYAEVPQDAIRPAGQAMRAAIREALDKLGATVEKRGEFQLDPKRKGIRVYVETEERLTTDWRQVDAEPAAKPMPPERRAGYQRRIEAGNERHAIPVIHVGSRVDSATSERERCPTCRGTTEDPVGGPCSKCWKQLDALPPDGDEGPDA
jgi:hypothetical protein